jgi:hypothetical protein
MEQASDKLHDDNSSTHVPLTKSENRTSMSNQAEMDPPTPSPTMFDVVAERDYDSMVEMYAANAQNAIVSYLAMRSRWKSSSSLMDEAKSGANYLVVLILRDPTLRIHLSRSVVMPPFGRPPIMLKHDLFHHPSFCRCSDILSTA